MRLLLSERRSFVFFVVANLGSFDPYECYGLISDHSMRKEHRAARTFLFPLLAERQCENHIHDFSDNSSKVCKRYLLFKTVGVTAGAK